jgi:DNA polymerase III delta subunit
MDFAGFVAELRGGKRPPPVCIFAGPEAFLRERCAALLAESDRDFGSNLIRLTPAETDWPRVADELYTAPFLANKKLVVLVAEGNFVHNHTDELREYLKQPSGSSVLAALVPTGKVPTLAGAWLVECRSLKPGDLQRWLATEAQRLGKSLDRAAGELLASRAGADLAALAGHLEKLALHAGARTSLTTEDVRALVGYQEEHEVYELSLAAASKDLPRAYRVLRALLHVGEPVQKILWKLAWQYRKLVEAKKMLVTGRHRFEVTSHLQITYYANEFLRMVDAHSIKELVDKHGEILKADVALKTSGNEAPVMESLVCRLAGK